MAPLPLRSSTARPAATALTRPCSQSMGKRQRPTQPRRRALLNSNIPTVIGSREPSEEPRGQRRALLDSDIPTVHSAIPHVPRPVGLAEMAANTGRGRGRGPALVTSLARLKHSHSPQARLRADNGGRFAMAVDSQQWQFRNGRGFAMERYPQWQPNRNGGSFATGGNPQRRQNHNGGISAMTADSQWAEIHNGGYPQWR